MRIFLDMDGVLADFNAGYEKRFGVHPMRLTSIEVSAALRETPDFFRDLPPMADLDALWRHFGPLKPTILTGVPRAMPSAIASKRDWIRRHLGDVPVIGCLRSEKHRHGCAGDLLIDDWEGQKRPWERMGGFWITHVSAEASIEAHRRLAGMADAARDGTWRE